NWRLIPVAYILSPMTQRSRISPRYRGPKSEASIVSSVVQSPERTNTKPDGPEPNSVSSIWGKTVNRVTTQSTGNPDQPSSFDHVKISDARDPIALSASILAITLNDSGPRERPVPNVKGWSRGLDISEFQTLKQLRYLLLDIVHLSSRCRHRFTLRTTKSD